MKTLRNCSYIFLIMTSLNLAAQVKEIPVTTSSKEALNFFLSGRDKFENQEIAQAAPLFDKAIEKDPQFALAYLYRSQSGGGFNVFSQNLEKAVSLADKASDGEKLQILCFKAIADGDGPKSDECLDKLLSSYPSDKRVQMQAGEYFYTNNDFQKALDHFNKSAELDKNYAPVYNMIGYCQSSLNNYPESEKAFQTYISLIPDKPNPYDSYAELLLKMGKYDESIVQYKKALEKDPSFVSSLAGIGNNYVFIGDYESGRKYYQQYYDNSSSIGGKLDALKLKAITYIHEGKSQDAVKGYDDYRALAEKENLPPNVINSYASQGFIVSESGNPKEGRKYFEKATDLIGTSNLPEATRENLNTDAMLWRFYYLTANNELDNAAAQAEKCKDKVASRKNPVEEMFLSSLLGMYDIKKGDFDQAISDLSKGDNQDPLTWYYTAQAYHKIGDKGNSEKLYDKVAKCNVNSMNLAFVKKNATEELKNSMSATK